MSRPIGSLRTGTVQITAAGTRQPLVDAGQAFPAATVTIQALSTNTGVVTVGDVAVVAAVGTQGSATQRGIRLAAGDTISLDVIDITRIYVDCATNGDGVSWLVGSAS